MAEAKGRDEEMGQEVGGTDVFIRHYGSKWIGSMQGQETCAGG